MTKIALDNCYLVFFVWKTLVFFSAPSQGLVWKMSLSPGQTEFRSRHHRYFSPSSPYSYKRQKEKDTDDDDDPQQPERKSFIRRHLFWFICLSSVFGFFLLLNWASTACAAAGSKGQKQGHVKQMLCSIAHAIHEAVSAITGPIMNAWRNLIELFSIVLGAAGLFWFAKKLGLLGGRKSKEFAEATVAEDEGAKVAVIEDKLTGKKRAVLIDKDGKVVEGVTPTRRALEAYQQQVELEKSANRPAGPSLSTNDITDIIEGGGEAESDTKSSGQGEEEAFTAEGTAIPIR